MNRGKKIVALGCLAAAICIAAIISMRMLRIDIPFLELKYEIIHQQKDRIDISIGIVEGEDPFHLIETQAMHNPVITAASVKDVDAEFVADPFMINEKNRWYMFFEVMNRKTNQGDIGLATSDNGLRWEYRQIVLDEPFHMSYPHVFKDANTYYMVVETNLRQELRLYQSTDFPLAWQYVSTLMRGKAFTDSTPFKYEGRWWLFTETDPEKDGTLSLYHSDALLGPWAEHPASPVVMDDENIARPAGKVLLYKHKLFRIAQDDWPTYGNNVRIFQIDMLTTTHYAEHELCGLPEIQSKGLVADHGIPAWRYDGFHQLDPHQIGEKRWIACIDGFSRTSMFRQLALSLRIPYTKKRLS